MSDSHKKNSRKHKRNIPIKYPNITTSHQCTFHTHNTLIYSVALFSIPSQLKTKTDKSILKKSDTQFLPVGGKH